ncbi:hypothetical protein LH452_14695 [Laribacter hongkongensis]|uniref:hypothetical protein n=1 Tax=Laribacter hongkongensis TaxID=168471 RepID=UPI001877EFE4|nr:hypothetical protein [Laribacter hongkongensis]MCG9060139.1 hypothetical protein [Laribacter hongkongensis]MCG9087236.1 hypothetical protein [Laribacter hongkongensis]
MITLSRSEEMLHSDEKMRLNAKRILNDRLIEAVVAGCAERPRELPATCGNGSIPTIPQ